MQHSKYIITINIIIFYFKFLANYGMIYSSVKKVHAPNAGMTSGHICTVLSTVYVSRIRFCLFTKL
jgi:hypothetical protein